MTKFFAIKTLYLSLLHYLTAYISTFLFLEFEEVLRLLLVGSLSSSEADLDGGDIVNLISIVVRSGTDRESDVACTTRILTVGGCDESNVKNVEEVQKSDDEPLHADDKRTDSENQETNDDEEETQDDEFVHTPKDYGACNQVKDDAQATQKTYAPIPSSSISFDYAVKFLNFDKISLPNTEVISLMDINVQHEALRTSSLLTISVSVFAVVLAVLLTRASQSRQHENSETKEEDVKDDESDHNKERYIFEDDADDGEFDDLD
uniref:Uncharacterized protein n=1 Tax=Tanacetum cinerariifolium TaxID=118510 RepID=A0A699H7J8_TANCI|nr:hypothetical protein [Tanacetum cinerariifolium]